MENVQLFLTLGKEYGPVTGLGLFILWIYVINPKIKKLKGTYVSYKHMNDKIATMDARQGTTEYRLDKIEERQGLQLGLVAENDRKVESLTLAQSRFDRDMEEMKYMMRDFTTTQKTTNRLLGETKDTNNKLLAFLEAPKKD